MALTEDGRTLLGILERRATEEERRRQKELGAAEKWAKKRVDDLKERCGSDGFRSLITLVELNESTPTEYERMLIDALSREIGVDFSTVAPEKSPYGGRGAPGFHIGMEVGALLELLRTNDHD